MAGNLFNALIMWNRIKNVFNGFACFLVDDVIGNTVENMHALFLLRGDDCLSFPKYLEASVQRNDFSKIHVMNFQQLN